MGTAQRYVRRKSSEGEGGPPPPSLPPYFFSRRSLNLRYTLLFERLEQAIVPNKNCWGKGRTATAANGEYRGKQT